MSYPGTAEEDRSRIHVLFWSRRNAKDQRESGEGFAVTNCIVSKLASLPKGVSDRLMTLRLPLANMRHAIVTSAYAPTTKNLEDVKERFYEDKLIRFVPQQENCSF